MELGIPITDDHIHVDRKGLGPTRVAEVFSRSGGTHLFVVNKMTHDYGFEPSEKGFRRTFEACISAVQQINRDGRVQAFAVVGPHPAELVNLWQAVGEEKAKMTMEAALKSAARYVSEGRATAIGEVGRPHFEVKPEIMEASNRLIDLTLELASEAGCAVQLHMESASPAQYEEVAERAKRAGLDPSRVVRHFSTPLIKTGEVTGIFPSLVANRDLISEALKQGNRFMMETDFIDDPSRPGAVMGPRTVPRTTRYLLDRGLMDERTALVIHKENVERVYGVQISL